jgi:NADPH2:quinone reductase
VRAVVYTALGGPETLELVEREAPVPTAGEVAVKVATSGVNPTDWKSRRGTGEAPAFPEMTPNQDGAGTIVAVGAGVDPMRVGERVWIFESAWQRAAGTAQEVLTIPSRQAVRLPDNASFDLGASLGIPALTAHRCLTVISGGRSSLGPGALEGLSVLVAGGAGAVGHAAIELARWSGAQVVATVSSEEKGRLAALAGADLVVNYRTGDPATEIRRFVPDGVHCIVEVASVANAVLDAAVLREDGCISVYASGTEDLVLDIRAMMHLNARYQFVYVYKVPADAKDTAVADVSAAVAAGALRVGDEAGLPITRFPLEDVPGAHRAVEEAVTGKVIIDVSA